MKLSKSKILTTGLAVTLAVALLVGGRTLAYLQSQTEDTVNNFETKKVMVTLSETTGNDYSIIPGKAVPKDPKVTVDNTLDAYVFIKVNDATDGLIEYAIADGWTELEGVDGVYWREVAENAEPKTFSVLAGDAVSYSAALENSDMLNADGNLKEGFTLTFKAMAIQKDPFDSAAAAYNRQSAVPVTDQTTLYTSVKNNAKTNVVSDMELKSVQPMALSSDKELILDGTVSFNGTSTATRSPFYFYGSVGKNPVLTVDGLGGVDCTNTYCFNVGRKESQKASLIINGGSFTAPVSVIQCQYGTVIINGGFFAIRNATEEYGSKYLINCIDDSYRAGTASITVTGGTFVNFNPADNAHVR